MRMNNIILKCLFIFCFGLSVNACAQTAQDVPYPISSWNKIQALDENTGSLAERGRAVFNNWCSACHNRDIRNAPGTSSLEFKYQGALPAALEDREGLTEELISFYVRNGVAMMPFFRPTEVSDDDIAALAAYLKK